MMRAFLVVKGESGGLVVIRREKGGPDMRAERDPTGLWTNLSAVGKRRVLTVWYRLHELQCAAFDGAAASACDEI